MWYEHAFARFLRVSVAVLFDIYDLFFPYTQCSYQAGVFDLTKCVAELLWDQFVQPLTDQENEQLLLQYKYVN